MLFIGLVGLILGAESLVRGSVSLALRFSISPLVIGMTIVSFGTSTPELLVSLEGVLTGYPDVSVGAVIGSNISNLGLVLGFTVLLFPIIVNRNSIRIDWPVMMLSAILFFVFARDGVISFYEGLAFIIILCIFLYSLIYFSRKKEKAIKAETKDIVKKDMPVIRAVLYLLVGIAALYFGSRWLVSSVVNIAGEFGISEKLISISVVALGTSLPELVTSAVAAYRKESDISMGNLIGSNIFNIFAIVGITAMVKPLQISDAINNFDVYVMLFISLLILPIILIGKKVGWIKGLILLLIYVSYIYFSFTHDNIGVLQ